MNSLVASKSNWELEAQKSRDVLQGSIQQQWILPKDKLPPTNRHNVLAVPRESGVLSPKELEISESDATSLVQKMEAGEWSAMEVTTAFSKRATIGHQLVRFSYAQARDT